MKLETREYQNFIVNKIKELVKENGKNVILELDCGMGKRVLIYRLITELFQKEKVIIFLQTQSSLQETVQYLNEMGKIKELEIIKSGQSSELRNRLINNNRVVLSLPTVFYNTLKKYPELSEQIEVAIINEVDTIIKRFSHREVLIMPWSKILSSLKAVKWIGMSGTLRDDHYVLDERQYKIRAELKTLLKFIPDSELVSIDDFIGTDLKDYIRNTEIYTIPIKDPKTAKIINYITELIKEERTKILEDVKEVSLNYYYQAIKDFYKTLPFLPIETEKIERLNKLLLLRKYLYSMPSKTFQKHLIWNKIDKEYCFEKEYITGKEQKIVELVEKYEKTAVLCSFLSTVRNLTELIKQRNIRTFVVTGTIKNKGEIIEEYRKCKEKAVLILSPVGERDIDIPQTEALIVFDLVNSPKTVYQKMKRSRGGKVFLLYYETTAEEIKLKRVISEILNRYPWSVVLSSNKK